MGVSSKRGKKAGSFDMDLEDLSDSEMEETVVEEEEEEEDEDEDEQEELGSSDDDEIDVDEEDEEEEEGEEGEEEEEGVGHNARNKDAEMEELEKEYMSLRQEEQDIWKNLKRHKDEDLQKGQAVKNQMALWGKALEFRILLQKALPSSNKLPQDSVRSSFCALDEEVDTAYSGLVSASKKTLDSLLELQEALLENNPSIEQSADGNNKQTPKSTGDSQKMGMEDDEEWLRISQMHRRFALFRDKSIDKWQRKTQVTTGVAAVKNKLQAFNQNTSEQVAAFMRDPSRMIKQMQQRRSTVGIYGDVPETAADATAEEAHPDGDPELLDDLEFYRQLLAEFVETVDPTSFETTFNTLKRSQNRKRKLVDRRASKSRKIRYNVHEKIVNFMAPQPMNVPPMAPKLFENLFGLRTQKPAAEA